jgi:hypothetical protein
MYIEEQRKNAAAQKKRDEDLALRNDAIMKQLAELMNKQNSKGKGKGKGKRQTVPDPSPEIAASTSTGLLQNIRNVFGGSQPQLAADEDARSHRSHHSCTSSFEIIEEEHRNILVSPLPVPMPTSQPLPSLQPADVQHDLREPTKTTKTVYLTKCALNLNNQPIDQLESKQTKDQCMNDFNRLYLTNGLANSLQSNYINYQTFMNGCFISAWDLSTSGFVGNSYALPNIKTGTSN